MQCQLSQLTHGSKDFATSDPPSLPAVPFRKGRRNCGSAACDPRGSPWPLAAEWPACSLGHSWIDWFSVAFVVWFFDSLQTYCILSSNLQSLLQQSETRPAVRISHEYLPSVFILNSQMTGGYDINTSDFESEKRITKLRMGLSKIATQKSKLVGGFSPPLWKIWESSSVGMMTFPTIGENKKNNSKPPTSDY